MLTCCSFHKYFPVVSHNGQAHYLSPQWWLRMAALLKHQHTKPSQNVHPREVVSFLCPYLLPQLECKARGSKAWCWVSVGSSLGESLIPYLDSVFWKGLCCANSVCRPTTLKDKVWWKDLHFLGLISSGFCQSVVSCVSLPGGRVCASAFALRSLCSAWACLLCVTWLLAC